jgi:RimJ/RimL family protein N-acetyltransferase
MISIRRLQLGEGELYKQMRLKALQEAPYAFSSTYKSAASRTEGSWNEQADGTARESDRAAFIAFCSDEPIGIAALYRHPEGSESGEVLQVWVAPAFKGKRAAFDLLNAVFQWGAENGFREIVATITKENMGALKFYRKYGFVFMDGTTLDGLDDPVLIKEIEVVQAREPDALPRAGDAQH